MAKTIAQLRTEAQTIKNETTIGANTATRVGGFGEDIVDYLDTEIDSNFATGEDVGDVSVFDDIADLTGKTEAEKALMLPNAIAVSEIKTPVDLTTLNEVQVNSSPNKTWGNSYKGKFLPVKAGEVYDITTHSVTLPAIIIPLKNCAFKNSTSYASNIATGYSDRITITAGTTLRLTIPTDCTTLYLQTTLSSGDITPIVVKVEQAQPLDDVPTDGSHKAVTSGGLWMQERDTEGLDVYMEKSALFLYADMVWDTTATNISRFYYVNGGDHLRIKANASLTTYFAFLISEGTMAQNTQPTMTSTRYSLAPGGEIDIVVPQGTHYLWVFKSSSSGSHLPQVVVRYVDKRHTAEVVAINTEAKADIFPAATTWSQATGRYTVFIPVDGNTEYILEGGESTIATYFFVVKSTAYANNAAPDFATGETARHTLYTYSVKHYTTPSDARFIAMMAEFQGTDISPKSIKKVVKFSNGILYGKKVLCIGDSVTWMAYYTNALQQKTKCILYNRGHSGTTVANYDGSLSTSFVERVGLAANDEFCNNDASSVSATGIGMPTSADIVIILGGVNDWARVRRAQQFTIGDVTAANTKTTFAGAWKFLLSAIKTKYPQAKIILLNMYDVWNDEAQTTLRHSEVTLTNGSDISGGYSVISMTTTGQSTPVSFDDLRDVVEKVAKLYGCDCIDLRGAGFSAFVSGDRTTYYNNADGLHVNTKGGEMIADFIIARCFGG